MTASQILRVLAAAVISTFVVLLVITQVSLLLATIPIVQQVEPALTLAPALAPVAATTTTATTPAATAAFTGTTETTTTTLPSITFAAAKIITNLSSILQYNDRIIAWVISNVVLRTNKCGEGICLLAQIGALLLLRNVYTQLLRPLYCILSTKSRFQERYCRYGLWAIIVGDLNLGDVSLMREYAGELVSQGMNVLILDCSVSSSSSTSCNSGSSSGSSSGSGGGSSTKDKDKVKDDTNEGNEDKTREEREERLRNEVVKIFMEDLRRRGRRRNRQDKIGDTKDDDDDNDIDNDIDNDPDSSDDNDDDDDDDNCAVEILHLKDGTISNFSSNISSKLGDMAKNGGIGMFIHCYSSRQAAACPSASASSSSLSSSSSKSMTTSTCTNNYKPQTFLSILNLILPYMMFRGTGAIINVCREDFDINTTSNSTNTNTERSDGHGHGHGHGHDHQRIMKDLFASSAIFDQSSKSRGVAECAFYRQFIRSLHYEYAEHGIDALTVTLPEDDSDSDRDNSNSRKEGFYNRNIDLEDVVKCSLQMLGEDYSELDLTICWYSSLLKSLFGY